MKSLAATLITLLTVLTVSATTPVVLKFKVLDSYGNGLRNVKVKTYQGNNVVESKNLRSGKATVQLEAGTNYTIEFSLNGFITKRISINTDLKGEEMWDFVYKFYVEMELAEEYSEISSAEDYFDYPAAIIELNSKTSEFDFNRVYGESSKTHRKAAIEGITEGLTYTE